MHILQLSINLHLRSEESEELNLVEREIDLIFHFKI